MTDNFHLAWIIYLVAVAISLVLVWLAVRRVLGPDTRRVLLLCLFAFLVVPARIEPGSEFWAPAFMAALMEAIDKGVDVALQRLWPTFVTMLALVLLSLVWRLRSIGRGKTDTA